MVFRDQSAGTWCVLGAFLVTVYGAEAWGDRPSLSRTQLCEETLKGTPFVMIVCDLGGVCVPAEGQPSLSKLEPAILKGLEGLPQVARETHAWWRRFESAGGVRGDGRPIKERSVEVRIELRAPPAMAREVPGVSAAVEGGRTSLINIPLFLNSRTEEVESAVRRGFLLYLKELLLSESRFTNASGVSLVDELDLSAIGDEATRSALSDRLFELDRQAQEVERSVDEKLYQWAGAEVAMELMTGSDQGIEHLDPQDIQETIRRVNRAAIEAFKQIRADLGILELRSLIRQAQAVDDVFEATHLLKTLKEFELNEISDEEIRLIFREQHRGFLVSKASVTL